MNIKWSAEERQFIRDNAHCMKDKDIAVEITSRSGRQVSLGAVRKMRQRMGVTKKSGRGVCKLKEHDE